MGETALTYVWILIQHLLFWVCLPELLHGTSLLESFISKILPMFHPEPWLKQTKIWTRILKSAWYLTSWGWESWLCLLPCFVTLGNLLGLTFLKWPLGTLTLTSKSDFCKLYKVMFTKCLARQMLMKCYSY